MIEQQARVISVQGDELVLEADTQTACGSCEVKSGCGTSVLSKWLGRKFTHFNAQNTVNACVGDEVIVGLAESALLTGSVVIYLWPLLGMIFFALAADQLFSAEQAARDLLISLIAFVGAAAVFGVCHRYLSTASSQQKLNPVVLRKLISTELDVSH